MIPDPITSYEVAKLRHQEAVARANLSWQLEGLVNNASAHNFWHWLRQQEVNLHYWRKQRILKQAISRAYRKFAKRHPRWAASLFDEYFLMANVPSLMISETLEERSSVADELVVAWANQLTSISFSPERLKHSEIRSVVIDFLADLANELRDNRKFTPSNRRGWSKLKANQSSIGC